MDSPCNAFDPCFVELDCGDDGAPVVDHLHSPVQILEVLWLDKAPKGAAKLFSAMEELTGFRNMDSRCNAFDPCFVELDCGDDGAPMVDHLRRPLHIFEVLWLDKAPKGAC
jgi:hypothetical protein